MKTLEQKLDRLDGIIDKGIATSYQLKRYKNLFGKWAAKLIQDEINKEILKEIRKYGKYDNSI